jgi:hypothetical protein
MYGLLDWLEWNGPSSTHARYTVAHVRYQYSSTLTSLCSRSHRTSQYSTSSLDSPFFHAAAGTYCRSGGCRPFPPPPLAGMHLLSLPSQSIRFSLPLVASRGWLRPCCYTAATTGPANSGPHQRRRDGFSPAMTWSTTSTSLIWVSWLLSFVPNLKTLAAIRGSDRRRRLLASPRVDG